MEQGNFESQTGAEASDMELIATASSDEALPGPNFEGDRTVWENTISLTLQSGGSEQAQEELSPALTSDDDDEEQDELDGLHALDGADIDLTEPVVQEASLLDHETDELGETEAPNVVTDDSKSRSKKRGGHRLAAPRGPSRSR
jgi:hypothetical protein